MLGWERRLVYTVICSMYIAMSYFYALEMPWESHMISGLSQQLAQSTTESMDKRGPCKWNDAFL